MISLKYVADRIGSKVFVTDSDGSIYRGILCGYQLDFDTNDEKDKLELDTGEETISIPIEEVESMLVIE